MTPEPRLGTLVVVVLKARNLIDKHFYKQDVFAQACVNGTSQKTPVDRKGGQHPLWDTELRFPIMKDASNKTRKLEIACFAKERRTDDLLGKGVVDITETLQTGEFDDWVKLHVDGVERGEVYLEMTYFLSGPPPKGSASSLATTQNLTRRPSKLPASERLWRPPQIHHSSSSPPRKGHSPRSASAERQAPYVVPKNAPLPPLPKGQLKQTSQAPLPEILLPGGSTKPKQHTTSTTLPLVPGIDFVPAPQVPDFMHHPSPSPPLLPSNPAQLFPPYTTPYFNNSTVSSNPNPYLAQSTATTPIQIPLSSEPQSDHPHYMTIPFAWDQSRPGETTTGFSSPAYGQYISPHPIEPHGMYKIHQTARNGTPFSWPNPDLENRYQKALPLPQESQPTLTPFNKQPVPHLDADRLHDLRIAETEATQRKEQERRDLELALLLDKELNT